MFRLVAGIVKKVEGDVSTDTPISLLSVSFLIGNLPPPHIIAVPTSKVLSKDTVTIQCHIPEAEAYNIYKVEGSEPMDRSMLPLPKKKNTLRIQEMTPDQAGLYRCVYQRGGKWSEPSDPLLLVMTGEWDTEVAEPGQASLQREEPGFQIQSTKQQSLYAYEGIRDEAETAFLRVGLKRNRNQRHVCSWGTKRDSACMWPLLYHQTSFFCRSL